jgi:hypothetical protein
VIEGDTIDDVTVRLFGSATPHLVGPGAWSERDDRGEVVSERQCRQLCLVDARPEARVVTVDRIRSATYDNRVELRRRVSEHDVHLRRPARFHLDIRPRGGAEAEPTRDQRVAARRKQAEPIATVDARDIAPNDRSVDACRDDDGAGDRITIGVPHVTAEHAGRLRGKKGRSGQQQRNDVHASPLEDDGARGDAGLVR